uniref:SUI1 domain-containing protein n=1 Tax=Macrostomum lignano TaxID=282301 RepID=A0A1I8IVE9_9PLAT
MPGLFHKPFRVKSHAKLKSTERRQLLDELRRCYPDAFAVSGGDEAEIRLLGGNRKCDLFKSKIVAHTDQTGFVYFAAGQPILEGLRPTVYALWRAPLMSNGACVDAASGLLSVLQNGADLMAPGLVAPMPDSLWLLAGRRPPRPSWQTAEAGAGAVLVDHVIGDQLWLRGDQSVGPTTADAAAAVEEEAEVKVAQLSEEMGAASVDLSCNKPNEQFDEDSGESDAEAAVESADRHLLNCLLHSLLQKIRDKDLPILCSSLLANYMSRYSSGSPLNLKATSYKKFGAFVQAMKDEGLLELNNDKGVMSVVSINWRHPLLQVELQPSLTYVDPAAASASTAAAGAAGSGAAGEGPLTIEDVLFVTASSGELFKRWGHCKGSCLTGKQVRQFDYGMADRPGEVTLDALLSRLASQCGRPVLEDSLSWERLFQVCSACMTPGYRVLDCHGAVLLERRGAAPRVSMRVESRASNKCVSLLAGLPDFGVDAVQFAKRVQRALSVSAGVQSAPTGGGSGEVVSVQGDQLAYLYRLLTEDYQISKKYVTGFTPGGKKKKNKGNNKGKK